MSDLVDKYPRFASAHYNLAIYLRAFVFHFLLILITHSISDVRMGDYAGSAKHNELAIDLQSHFPEAFINLG